MSIKTLLASLDIFKGLSDKELTVIVDLSEVRSYNEGDLVFESGSTSKCLYIVKSGEIGISGGIDDRDRKQIARFIDGEVFGEFDLFEGDLRTADARAVTDSELVLFPGTNHSFEKTYKTWPDLFARIYYRLITINSGRIRHTNRLLSEKTQWIEEIRNQMFRDGLTGLYNRSYISEELNKNSEILGDIYGVLMIKPDDFKQINDRFGHEAGDEAMLVLAETIRETAFKNQIVVRYRGNEFAVFMPEANSAEAEKRATVFLHRLSSLDLGLAIHRKSLQMTYSIGYAIFPIHGLDCEETVQKAFATMFEQRESGGNGIRQAGEEELSKIKLLRSVDIFSSLQLYELKQLAGYLHEFTVNAGDMICRQGDPGEELYVIENGEMGVVIKIADGSEKEIVRLTSGNFFGEMAIFDNAPRSASCVARRDSSLLRFHKDDFSELMKAAPDTAITIMKNMLNITSDRIDNSGRFLSELVKWGNEAGKRALTDTLTGTYNRRFMDSAVSEKFRACFVENKPFALIMADLDYFREVNGQYSHEIGDLYIREVASVFISQTEKSDFVIRYGGDEFVIVMPETDLKAAEKKAEKIRKKVEKLNFLSKYDGPEMHISVSLGLAVFPDHRSDLAGLREAADAALYKAKENGRNRVVTA
ncbi:MAG: diguanylate cyclase [Spirochaetales bacterium]|nr:diguanylate cyclase [Spirochaetales bacterium]